ncbi:MAG: hypothetical protein HOQ28_03605, partial [Thermoleophilia bacterium]|nr:hypothetical protein [Thermoleophilia bacterium]
VPELPPPLPPAERTVGQVVAETIRAYGERFWGALPLGIPVALVDQLSVRQAPGVQMLVYWAAAPLFVGAYIRACMLVLGARPNRTAIAVAVLIYLPFPALRAFFILPGIAWFAFIGLAVPAALVERRGLRDSLERGRRLGTADYVHALGSLAALVVVVGIAGNTLSALLHTQGDNGQRVAVALSDLVLSPMLFLGAALLYLDQAARVGSAASDRRRRRDAHFHPPVDADAAGRHDAQVEP